MAGTAQVQETTGAEGTVEGVALGELLQGVAQDEKGALWRLRRHGRQLDANVVRLPSGGEVAVHTEAHLDVVVIVVAGGGRLTVAGQEREVRRGTLAVLPAGAPRGFRAGRDGLVYLTVHRRRAGLRIGRRPAAAAVPETGDHCELHVVCGQCHRHAIEADARFCSRCGTPLKPAEDQG
ncbi:hypothetical protein AMK16_20640 [Streptomyces sp. CB00455]|uniref:zinc ribbon domain-containing protein n=1 Tax=Streptomyces sp. CB00455 TaxID=1703927 RepID=UPI00093F7F9E|nr:zinc ribbon domain-containing protein [Streptomyces sp. CB00455]OKK17283.1 hypothetical protein AMK16_20640 [Streptomyces sp. CB00455]